MFELIKENRYKIVDSREKADALILEGFKEISSVSEPEEAEQFQCPYCDKVYKTKEGLEKHIAEKHSDVLNGGNDGNSSGKNNTGGAE